ncbi:MAG: hypothetical protein MI784_07190 [Cytophagales bacterium]|nr:hypothetical protein [Cytophagales bacterium]
MKTIQKPRIFSCIEPALQYVKDRQLKTALLNALSNQEKAIATIEGTFGKLTTQKWPEETFKFFFNAWKATHLKMLAIYGLSCRLQRMALEESDDPGKQHELLLAAAKNAETSYEDLGLDFDGETHTKLYHDLAESFVSDDSWTLDKWSIPEANAFKEFVYRNMVVENIQVGLFTNMFSEIYNHAEYTVALSAFNELIDAHYDFVPDEKKKTTTYIFAHLEDETELNHFSVVIDSLNYYAKAENTAIDYELAQRTFETYLLKMARVFEQINLKLS